MIAGGSAALIAAATFVLALRLVSLRGRWPTPVTTLRPPRPGPRGPQG